MAVYSSREHIDRNLILDVRPSRVKLEKFNWRIDVCISTSSLSRSLQPFMRLEFVLSNGRKYSFEMTLNSFNILRFNVAFVLKEMDDILQRQVFKLLAE